MLCTNARRNLELLEALGRKGCKTCIILSSQPDQYPALLECAARYQMRLLGPNSPGLLAPWQGPERQLFSGPYPARQAGVYLTIRRRL